MYPRRFTFLLFALLLSIGSVTSHAYEILLDIDNDNDPATVNEVAPESLVVVKIILRPSQPAEWIAEIFFGLGGSCWMCNGVQDYGIAHDLYPPNWGDWTEHPDLVGHWDSATRLGCPDDPGFHDVYFASALEGGFTLSQPVFIASFTAWVDEPMWGWCPHPPGDLAAFHGQGEGGFWNRLTIGGPVVSTSSQTWGEVRQLFR